MTSPARRRLACALALLALAGCGGEDAPRGDYAARVGEEVLTHAEVAEALEVLPPGLDSLTAHQQVVDQWVRSRLLAEEARRQGLLDDDAVRRQLADNERAVLAAALIDRFFEANPAEPTDEDLRTYYDQHRERLALREPYVRVRHLVLTDEARAEAARAALARAADSPFADSLWVLTARTYADPPDGPLALAETYVPASRLAETDAELGAAVSALGPGEVAPVVASAGRFHVVQLVDREPTGTVPELGWVEGELRQRLAIEARNRMLARQVQQLRTEAQAAGRLDIR
ncbi:MAG: peptidylprolyl isomerase [Rubricoccaceae bacterium]|nr:peptidylprolyl isomerase [Rubricoccaceae bacterium]